MILFPAIDLKNGQCVRLEQGDMARATVFNLDPAAHHAGEMCTQEGETRVGNRIEQVVDQIVALWGQFIIFATEWDDLQARVGTAQTRDAVRLQPSTINQAAAMHRSLCGFKHVAIRYFFDR